MNEQPWVASTGGHGRIFLVTDNPISRALVQLAGVLDRETYVLVDDSAVAELRAAPLGDQDAVLLCDHDTPDCGELLRLALVASTGYVAMLGSRVRARATFAELGTEFDPTTLERFHVPAGLDLGGKEPGEIALSVLAEIVAESYGRSGAPMRRT